MNLWYEKIMELKGSKTEQNLKDAFAGESQARNKYTYYASKAKKEGYNIIADKFTQTADNEKEHAKLWFKLLHGGEVPSTIENLKDAAEGENIPADETTTAEEDMEALQIAMIDFESAAFGRASVCRNAFDDALESMLTLS